MSDSKVTEMTAATSVNSADVLYLIQNSTDKKISVATLLANLPTTATKLSGTFSLSGTSQTINNSGAVNVTSSVTKITNDTAATLTIANGTTEGQIKVILCTAATNTTTLSSNVGPGAISFQRAGHSVLLIWQSGSWWPIGGTAPITY